MFFLKKVTIVLIMTPLYSWAEVDLCEITNSVSQVVACAESRSPEIKKAEANLKAKKSSQDFAGQLQNPELSSEYVSGTTSGKNQSELDLSLSFPIEIGGGRSARKSSANFEYKKAEIELLKARGEVRKETLVKLVRVRQIHDELSMIQDSIDTFSKLIRQYQGRPKLSPEQEITFTVFNVSKTDYSFKKLEYEEELKSLDSYFKIATDKSLSSLKSVLASKITKWPVVSDKAEVSEQSPLLALYDADVELAKADYSKATSDVWPTISVGPSFKRVNDGTQNTDQLGVNLSMPLPVLSLNGGGRALATANIQSSELRRELALKQLKNSRESMYQLYTQSVKLLQESANGISQEERHKKVESLFFRGLVPSSLVIEAHRTLVDYNKSRSEREIKTLEAFLDIQIIDGKAVEFNL